jgi:hypothetical protein
MKSRRDNDVWLLLIELAFSLWSYMDLWNPIPIPSHPIQLLPFGANKVCIALHWVQTFVLCLLSLFPLLMRSLFIWHKCALGWDLLCRVIEETLMVTQSDNRSCICSLFEHALAAGAVSRLLF